MGSNQGKRPHHADRGAKVWSRDEKRENRKTMRDQAKRQDIVDSVSSNDYPDEDDWEVCDHELDENGWCPCDDRPRHRRTHRRPSAKWCRRKEGREHEFFFLTKSALGWLDIYACAVCGKKKYIKSGGHPNP